MLIHPAKANASAVGVRIAVVIAGTLTLLLALLAIVRPEMMHRLMSAMGL